MSAASEVRGLMCAECGHHWIAHAPTVPGCAMCDCAVRIVPGTPTADHRTIPEPDSPASDERTGDDD